MEFSGRGFATLLYKELLRFWKVSFQTLAAPILTALLYLQGYRRADFVARPDKLI